MFNMDINHLWNFPKGPQQLNLDWAPTDESVIMEPEFELIRVHLRIVGFVRSGKDPATISLIHMPAFKFNSTLVGLSHHQLRCECDSQRARTPVETSVTR